MADAYQIETSTDRYLLEDGSGVVLLEQDAAGGPSNSGMMDFWGALSLFVPLAAVVLWRRL